MSLIEQFRRQGGHAVLLTASALCGLVCVGDALADEVKLKTGKVRQGRVVAEDEEFVILETRLGRLRIPASAVESISRSADAGTDESSGETPSVDAEPEPADERPDTTPRRTTPLLMRISSSRRRLSRITALRP